MAVRGGDGARDRLTVGLDPSRHQPVGRVEDGDVERGKPCGALARHPPQHRIDQAGKARRRPVRLRKPHREIDGGMVGHIEKQDLRRTDKQRGLDPRRLRRQTAFEQNAEQMTQGAEPAQHRRDDGAGERAVALFERIKLGCTVEQIVERVPPAQHAVDDVGGDAADGEARHVLRVCGTSLRFGRSLHSRIGLLAAAARLRQVKGDANRPHTANAARERCGATPIRQPPADAGGRARAGRSRGAPGGKSRSEHGLREVAGRGGLDPTRYGDWEINGLTSDF